MPLPAGINGLNNARANAVLEAAGAWDPTPTEFFTSGALWMSITLTYDEDAGTVIGAVDVQLELSPYSIVGNVPAGAQEWVQQTIYAPGAVVGGADTQSLAQAEYTTFDPTAVTAQAITFAPIALQGLWERARIRARESGDAANPGVCQITANLYAHQMFGDR